MLVRERSSLSPSRPGLEELRFDRAELAGAVADLGVMVPIAVALIVQNGLSATAVLLPAALLYIGAGLVYRVPVPVQPLKAFGAIAIAQGLGSSEIAAGALLMGATFVALSASGYLDRVAKIFPQPIIRGVQLSVGLLFCQLAFKLVTAPPAAFADHAQPVGWLVGGTIGVAAVALLLRRYNASLFLFFIAVVMMTVGFRGPLALGPSPLHLGHALEAISSYGKYLHGEAISIGQVATAKLSCEVLGFPAADAARTYFGERAARVRPGRLALSLGLANLLAGAISGMPICHGAGGMTAHRSFGARSGGAPIAMGFAMLAVALLIGNSLTTALAAFPLPILAGLLAVAGLLHIALLKDLRQPSHWMFAIAVGVTGFISNLVIALTGALIIWWLAKAFGVLGEKPR